ncbi:MAG: carA [Candidatus Saccharibacteria bacterium]|nr:carA [Candidatus Saccharibacteria bacterium]
MVNKSRPVKTTKTTRINRSSGGDFFSSKTGRLDLSDGSTFGGKMPDWQTGSFTGEVVFNTGMSGYVESITDPSYSNQILVFTYPLIGNYGVSLASAESGKIQVAGVIMSELAAHPSHTKPEISLAEWLKSQNIPVLYDVDTRSLTKHLRVKGTMAGSIGTTQAKPKDMKLESKIISITEPEIYNPKSKKKVILVDCGAKDNILRSLCAMKLQVKKVPYDYDYTKENYDGVVLSNGPGDPTDYAPTIAVARKALKIGKPVFGICLGNQVLGLAAGGKTFKLKFGHRGHNQPCMESDTERCYITSQNHGYALDAKSLPKNWDVWFRNLNDDSVEGIKHVSKPFFSVQFHPEACPGPTDTNFLFEKFRKLL